MLTKKNTIRAGLLGAVAAAALMVFSPLSPLPAQTNPAAMPARVATQNLPDFADLSAAVSPAVVQIAVTATEVDPEGNVPPQFRGTPFAPFFGQGQPQPHRVRGLGSGFVIDPSGYIVTNFHVAGRADDIQVVFADGSRLPAKRIGGDERTDLALLKVEAPKPLAHVQFGDSDQVRVGQWVLAVGNPFGLGGTVTSGIVSARSRDIGAGPYDDFLQIDAAINQGNSGGPTFDREGNVIGVNTAIYSPNGGSVGLGFAIPANVVKKVVAELREHGKVDRAWMGVSTQGVDSALAAALKLPAAKGALIGGVEPEGPAARAGLRRGDVILSLDGTAINDPRDLARKVGDRRAKDEANIEYWRDGRRAEIRVTLGTLPDQKPDAAVVGQNDNPNAGGVGLMLAQGPRGEVVVADVQDNSPAEKAGLARGDRLVEVDRKKIKRAEDVVAAVRAARKEHREAIALFVERQGTPLYLALPLPTAKG
jgi:serine protease Do